MTDCYFLSATELAQGFGDRSPSPVDVLDAIIARATGVQASLNSFRFEDAFSKRRCIGSTRTRTKSLTGPRRKSALMR